MQNTYFTALQKDVQKLTKLILPGSLHVTFDSSIEDATFELERTTIFWTELSHSLLPRMPLPHYCSFQ